jgi:hypothetical protein
MQRSNLYESSYIPDDGPVWPEHAANTYENTDYKWCSNQQATNVWHLQDCIIHTNHALNWCIRLLKHNRMPQKQ